MRATVKARDLVFEPDRSLGEELELRAQRNAMRTFLTFEGDSISYWNLNSAAARVAQFMLDQQIREGDTVGILMPNLPAYLEIFFATQRIGACVVPINTSLKGEGLSYIINNAGISMVFTVASLVPELERIQDRIAQSLTIIIVPEHRGNNVSDDELEGRAYIHYKKVLETLTSTAPKSDISRETNSMLMYTSGTTGYPKGVVYSYGVSQLKVIRLIAHLLVTEDDIYYTCLPLFHANALIITLLSSLYGNAQIALSRKFSAKNFWKEVRESHATIFNTLGTMIAILMKQPADPADGQHQVRRVVSAACPAELWEDFENRFKVKLTESFGAVDGGGIMTMNVGNAPVGSIGKPMGGVEWRLIDERGKDVEAGEAGELIHYVGDTPRGQVKYHNNEQASSEKTREGWVYSGDLMRADKDGFLYFIGRNTDSMRCGGENVSALEVETVINQFEAVLESAAYGVPSELAEEDIMVAVQAKLGCKVNPEELHKYLQDKLAKFAIPKYIRIVDQLPKTETHRIVKHVLKEEGLTEDTWTAIRETALSSV